MGIKEEAQARKFLVLMLQNPKVLEVFGEYALVTQAFDHWCSAKGRESKEACQYQQLIDECSEEIRAFMSRERALPEK